MAECEHELLTIPEIAQVLRVRRGRAYQLARAGILPGLVHLGRQLRVDRIVFRTWLAGGGRALPAGWRHARRPRNNRGGSGSSEMPGRGDLGR